MSKHTPGPWDYECFTHRPCESSEWEQGYAIGPKGDMDDYRVATLWDEAGGDDETLPANAHLIAAAPDLLEALEEVVAISDRKHDAWDKAKAAISKAKGE